LRTPEAAAAAVGVVDVVPVEDVDVVGVDEGEPELDDELEHAARPSAITLATDAATARLIRMHSP
jgi:hypothetical protein